ncbi:MAG TPA: hypothetical protein VL549_01510 [Gemmatimonadales bacterium]|nr:hypothetical protein [Gemmatimonadales bacterium]
MARRSVDVRVNEGRHTLTVTIGPFHVPQSPSMMGDMMMMRRNNDELEGAFTWPATVRFRGVTLEVIDSAGHPLPRRLLHHTYMVNFDRRQLTQPISECPFSFGEETQDITIPGALGLPMAAGMRLGIVIMWDNLTGHDVDGAYVRYTFLLNPRHRQPAPRDVLPFLVDVNHVNGGADGFEVPPGGLVVTKQFTVGASGRLLAASGHLHDYAVMMRLEDAANGRTLATVRTDRDSTGHTLRVQRPIFALWHRGPHLNAGHPYRLVVVYDNPTSDTLINAMGIMAGLYAPDRLRDWPAVDPRSADYVKDKEGFGGVDSLLATLDSLSPSPQPAQRVKGKVAVNQP